MIASQGHTATLRRKAAASSSEIGLAADPVLASERALLQDGHFSATVQPGLRLWLEDVYPPEGGEIRVGAGDCVLARAGEWVRYSVGDSGADYISVCAPAFTVATANIDPEPAGIA